MTIIDQLDQTVTPSVLGEDSNVAGVSLLEQFYAILIARLAQPAFYSQLLRDDQSILLESNSSQPLFEQLWPTLSQRQLLIAELAATHHVETTITEQLLINATHLAYQELNNLANGQFLPAFLQAQQRSIRQYLPVWAEEVILPVAIANEQVELDTETLNYNDNVASNSAANNGILNDSIPNNSNIDSNVTNVSFTNNNVSPDTTLAPVMTEQALMAESIAVPPTEGGRAATNEPLSLSKNPTDAIHANPSNYYDPQTAKSRLDIRTRNRKNDLIVRALILMGVLAAIGLVWALVINPNYMTPAETVVAPPVVTAPSIEQVAAVLTPAELIVGVDDSGNLYRCTATVGDTALQSAVKKSLNVSFEGQASICELTVQKGVANSLSTIDIKTLPDILTLLRSVPFARLQLQNDTLSLEAPDAMMLQRLLTDMRTLVPTISIASAAPLPLSNSDDIFNNERNPLNSNDDNNSFNNTDINSEQDYQESDDNTNDSVAPAPPRNNNANSHFNNGSNNHSNNSSNSNFSNDGTATGQSGPMSAAEADALANNTIVAEKLRNERPIDKNLTQNN